MTIERTDVAVLKIGDFIAGVPVSHFVSELDKGRVKPTNLVTGMHPVDTSYNNVTLSMGMGKTLEYKAAIPADVWFCLKEDGFCILPSDVEKIDLYLMTEKMKLKRIAGGLRPRFLTQPANTSEAQAGTGKDVLFTIRYQTKTPDEAFDWEMCKIIQEIIPSMDGNPSSYKDVQVEKKLPETICGFIDFLVGPIGVMDSIDLCGEETGDVGTVVEGGAIIPPKTERQGKPCLNLVWERFVTDATAQYNVKNLEGEPKPKIHYWLRIRLSKVDKYPTPGEFLCLLCRPWIDFAWFKQKTSPIVTNGKFFTTAAYTSGIIQEVEGNNKYTVLTEGTIVSGIPSSDYLEYVKDERVALIHTYPSPTKLSWKDSYDISNLRIVPVTFYL